MSPTPWRIGNSKASHVAQVVDADGNYLGWLYTGDGYQGNIEAVLRAVNSLKESDDGKQRHPQVGPHGHHRQ